MPGATMAGAWWGDLTSILAAKVLPMKAIRRCGRCWQNPAVWQHQEWCMTTPDSATIHADNFEAKQQRRLRYVVTGD